MLDQYSKHNCYYRNGSRFSITTKCTTMCKGVLRFLIQLQAFTLIIVRSQFYDINHAWYYTCHQHQHSHANNKFTILKLDCMDIFKYVIHCLLSFLSVFGFLIK
jgi:hypothetical protein